MYNIYIIYIRIIYILCSKQNQETKKCFYFYSMIRHTLVFDLGLFCYNPAKSSSTCFKLHNQKNSNTLNSTPS